MGLCGLLLDYHKDGDRFDYLSVYYHAAGREKGCVSSFFDRRRKIEPLQFSRFSLENFPESGLVVSEFPGIFLL